MFWKLGETADIKKALGPGLKLQNNKSWHWKKGLLQFFKQFDDFGPYQIKKVNNKHTYKATQLNAKRKKIKRV